MAKLPTIKRILREDLKEAPDWIDRLLYPINKFFEDVYNALNKNLTFVDNVIAQSKDLSFTTLAAYDGTAENFETLEFPRTTKDKPSGLIVKQIIQAEDNHTPVGQPDSVDATGDTHSNTTLDNISDMSGVFLGQSITGIDIPDGTVVDALNRAGTSVTLSQAATGTTVGGSHRYHGKKPGGVFADWLDENGTIRIFLVTGLLASKDYTMRVLLI